PRTRSIAASRESDCSCLGNNDNAVARSLQASGVSLGRSLRATACQPTVVSAQSRGLKLNVASQCQCLFSLSVGGETWIRALNPASRPVPSENVHNPRPVF